MTEKIYAADLFAGAGGTSTGLILAAQELNLKIDLTAVNHWEKAIKTHEANYPWARHLQADVEAVNPLEAIPSGRLHILVASPECTHHSRAAGGRPKNEQKRASAWAIFRWLELLKVDSVLVENVPEFQCWGPLDIYNQPVKSRRGEIFKAWLNTFKAFGYMVEARVLNAADFGAPTSRSRLFVAAKLGRAKPVFPTATHSKQVTAGKKKWRAAREVIDWSLKGESIFTRKRPLSPRTIQRIIEGLKRFGGQELHPFIILMEHGGGIRDIEDPLPTITTAKGGAFGLASPEAFILSQASGGAPRKVGDPVPTITSGGGHALVEPFIVSYHAGKDRKDPRVHSTDEPLKTIDTSNRYALAEPSIEKSGKAQFLEAFIIKYYRTSAPKSIEAPLDTIPTKDHFGLVQPSIQSTDEPLPMITNQLGLVQPEVNGSFLDIKFRMLQPKELAAATGFPSGYKFLGTKTDVVKQIGNAVVVDIAKALCRSLLEGFP